MQVVALDEPHPSRELVTIAARSVGRSSSPAVPSTCRPKQRFTTVAYG